MRPASEEDRETYAAGLYYVWTLASAQIVLNEASGREGYLSGMIMALKTDVAHEIRHNEEFRGAWNAACDRVEEAASDAERKEARWKQLEVLKGIAMECGILKERGLEPFEIEQFEDKFNAEKFDAGDLPSV